jgi:hypothetical protein
MRNNNTPKLLREEKGKRGCTLFLRFGRLQAAAGTKQSKKKAQADQPKRILPPIQNNQKIILFFVASSGNF